MAGSDALKRIGGGRWETRDGRFQIEPQSGTWVIVDTTQTNEFGLPLVRGPFASLGAAKDAIETTRSEGPVESPLAERIEEVKRRPPESPKPKTKAAKPSKAHQRAAAPETAVKAEPSRPVAKGKAAAHEPAAKEPPPEPEPPADPAWFQDLTPADRRTAKALIARLEGLDIDGAEAIARAELVDGEPALARLALERRFAAAARTRAPKAAILVAIEALLAGVDDDLEADWQLVDGHGRQIKTIDIGD
jgi:hypothetical protein